MHACDLVGRLAIRGRPSLTGDNSFTDEPVLILYADDSDIVCCPVSDATEYSQGVNMELNYLFCDNNWKDYGALLSFASATKAGVASDLFELLGIRADKKAINNFVKVLTFKQALGYLVQELGIEDFMRAVDVTSGQASKPLDLPEIETSSDDSSDEPNYPAVKRSRDF